LKRAGQENPNLLRREGQENPTLLYIKECITTSNMSGKS